MDGGEIRALDIEALSELSKSLLKVLLTRRPALEHFCQMQGATDSFDLYLSLPSPTGDASRNLLIWFAEDSSDLSLSFGGWHTHKTVEIEISPNTYGEWPIVEAFFLAIYGDISLASASPDSIHSWVPIIDDPSVSDAEIQRLLGGAGPIEIRSWDGTRDRILRDK